MKEVGPETLGHEEMYFIGLAPYGLLSFSLI